jgi:16S rRNA (uracil1498-N3)-methyltransferase
LGSGDLIAVLPDDGSLWVARVEGSAVRLESQHFPKTEASRQVVLALGLPRFEKLEESVRMGTELGAAGFVVFPAARSVVKWEPAKFEAKLERLRAIAREAAEVAFRTRLPFIRTAKGLGDVMQDPDALALSEYEHVARPVPRGAQGLTLVIGPEGGWSPSEIALIGDRALTLGPRVLRVDTAVAAACSAALLPLN